MLRRARLRFCAAPGADWYHSSANNQNRNHHEEYKASDYRENTERAFVPPSEGITLQKAYGIFGFQMSDALTEEVIKKKYKLLAKKHHPDMGGKPEDFQKLKEAHKLLLSVKHEPKNPKQETKFTRVSRAQGLNRVDHTNLEEHHWDVTDAFAVLICVPLVLGMWYWHNMDTTTRLSDARRRMSVEEMRPQKRQEVAQHEWHPWRATNDDKQFITDLLEDRAKRLGVATTGWKEGSTPLDEALERANAKSDAFNAKYNRPAQAAPPQLTITPQQQFEVSAQEARGVVPAAAAPARSVFSA